MGGTRGSGIVSSAADVLWMSVMRGLRVDGVCEMCMCLAPRGVGREELMDYVRCVCLWLRAAWVERGVSG